MNVDIFETLIPELDLISETGHQLWLEVASEDARALRYTSYCEKMCCQLAQRMGSQEERVLLF